MKISSPSTIRIRGVRYPKATEIPPKIWLNNRLLELEKSLKIKTHNLNGFGWGNDAKGALQLALAICAEIYTEETAIRVHVQFKEAFLDKIDGECFDSILQLVGFNEANVIG